MSTQRSFTTFLFVSLFSIFSINAQGQTVKTGKTDSVQVHRAQNVFIEMGGAGLFFSANYDTRFSQQRDGLGGRLGLGWWHSVNTTFVTVPLQLNYLVGGRSHFFEVGAGAAYMHLTNPYFGNPIIGNNPMVVNSTVVATSTIGYRYQPFNGGLNLRASFNPSLLQGTFVPEIGLSAGYTFR
ncbi:MAG TPA: hypothetical protein VIM89_19460 [Mucilaginibacter sp.]